MNAKVIYLALLMSAVMVSCNAKKVVDDDDDDEGAKKEYVYTDDKTSKDFVQPKDVIDSVSYLMGVNFGYSLKQNNFGELNKGKMNEGIDDFLAAKGNVNDSSFKDNFKIDPNEMEKRFNDFLSARNEKNSVPDKGDLDAVSYLMGVNFGSFLKQNNFGELNKGKMNEGIDDFLAAKGNVNDSDFKENFKIDPNEMNRVFNQFLQNRQQYLIHKNFEDGKKFLAKNKKKKDVVETESGLQYRIIEPGNSNKPSSTDQVTVRYQGKLIDGTVFDETKEDPVSFSLNQVIKGWTEGLQFVGEGGKIELFIPGDLAYGENSPYSSPIGPNSVLIFNVELLEVGE